MYINPYFDPPPPLSTPYLEISRRGYAPHIPPTPPLNTPFFRGSSEDRGQAPIPPLPLNTPFFQKLTGELSLGHIGKVIALSGEYGRAIERNGLEKKMLLFQTGFLFY